MENIDVGNVTNKYNSISEIWDAKDRWHTIAFKMIDKFINNTIKKDKNINHLKILNAGSGGNSYGISENNVVHIDIADQRIKHLPNAVVGNIENLPFKNEEFDVIICVGSVINYCDPIKVIEEFKRVLKKGGRIVLEYENSNTWELIGKKDFNKKVVFVKSFYHGHENIWFFSEEWINEILVVNGLEIKRKDKFHLISPLVYRITKNENFSSIFSAFDFIIKRIPFLSKLSSNTIILIAK